MSDDRDKNENDEEEVEHAGGMPSFLWLVILSGLVILSLWWTAGSL